MGHQQHDDGTFISRTTKSNTPLTECLGLLRLRDDTHHLGSCRIQSRVW